MEKRNVIEPDRTPDMSKQADADDMMATAVATFAPPKKATKAKGETKQAEK